MAAAWPDVVSYLVATLPTLPSWTDTDVYDGPGNVSVKPPKFCTVGFVDDDTAGSFTQTQNPDGWHVDEDGTVRFKLTAQTGDSDPAVVRTLAFGMFADLDAHIRKDQTLGGILSANATVVMASDDIRPLANKAGVGLSIVGALAYYTETFTP